MTIDPHVHFRDVAQQLLRLLLNRGHHHQLYADAHKIPLELVSFCAKSAVLGCRKFQISTNFKYRLRMIVYSFFPLLHSSSSCLSTPLPPE